MDATNDTICDKYRESYPYEITFVELPVCDHVDNDWDWFCDRCGEFYQREEETVEPPTPVCDHVDNDGDTFCDNCGEQAFVTDNPFHDGTECLHDFLEEIYIEATCIENGFWGVKCLKCNTFVGLSERTEKNPNNHINTQTYQENRIEATCIKKGSYDLVEYCKDCNAEISRKTQSIFVNDNHTPNESVEENKVASTCDKVGSYDSVVYCKDCGKEISRVTETIAKIEHSPKSAVKENKIEASCSKEGSYDWVIYCKVCNGAISRESKTIPKVDHTPKNAITENKVAATCQKTGSYDTVVYCKICKEELSRETKTVPLVEHSPGLTVEENKIEADCENDGSYDLVMYCTKCNTELQREYKINKSNGHSPKTAVEENRIEKTCLSNGSYDLVVYCEVCDKELSREKKIILAKGHEFDEKGICVRCGVAFKPQDVYTIQGNYIYFGEYPQSVKANDVTIGSITDARGYYLGSDGYYYAKIIATPAGEVTFGSGATITNGGTYYFKVEPIRWRILTSDGDKAFVFCDSIISTSAYDDWDNNYAESEIRMWLNETFYKTAFSELQRLVILKTMVDNSSQSAGASAGKDACENTWDNIFLLSYQEVTNSTYGFSSSYKKYDSARRMKPSDYALAIGAGVQTYFDGYEGNGYWWLRSRTYGAFGGEVSCIFSTGAVREQSYKFTNGIAPAMWIKLK